MKKDNVKMGLFDGDAKRAVKLDVAKNNVYLRGGPRSLLSMRRPNATDEKMDLLW